MEVIEALKKGVKKLTLQSMALSAVLIVLSIFLIINPAGILNTIVIIIGCMIILYAILHVISYFKAQRVERVASLELILGILELALGLYFIFNTKSIISISNLVFGIVVIVEGFMRLQTIINIRDYMPRWGIMLGMSIVSILFGIFIVVKPYDFGIDFMTVIGIILLISEIMNLIDSCVTLWSLKRMKNVVEKKLEDAKNDD